MREVDHDRKDQLQKIKNLLVHGEELYAVYDLAGTGTGFLGITDLRMMFTDLELDPNGKTNISLPFTKITAVGTDDMGSIVFKCSKLSILAGRRTWEFEFSSNASGHKAYELIMRNILQTEAVGI